MIQIHCLFSHSFDKSWDFWARADQNFVSLGIIDSSNCWPEFSSSLYPFQWIGGLFSCEFMGPVFACNLSSSVWGVFDYFWCAVSFLVNFDECLSKSVKFSSKNKKKNTCLQIKWAQSWEFLESGRTLLERGNRSPSFS